MGRLLRILLFLIVAVLLSGCAAKTPYTIVDDYPKRGIRQIAVMPVAGGSPDAKSAQMLRDKLSDGLYFKGYARISPAQVDTALGGVKGEGPEVVGRALKVDALLYTTLKEDSPKGGLFYAPTVMEAEFKLQSAANGETLWRVQYRVVRRNFGISRRQVELNSSKVFEDALQELVDRALETLPDVH